MERVVRIMARLVWIIVILVVVGIYIGVQVCGNQMIMTLKKVQVVCDDPKHQGNRVIATDEIPITVKRKDVRQESVKVQEIKSICEDCAARKDEEEKVTREKAKVPLLIGKSRDQVLQIMGEPDDTFRMMNSLTWKYLERFRPYRVEVEFAPRAISILSPVEPTILDHVFAIAPSGPVENWKYPADLVPDSILQKQPTEIRFARSGNRLRVFWIIGEARYAIVVTHPSTQVWREVKEFDRNTGDVRIHCFENVDWRHCRLYSFVQMRPNANFGGDFFGEFEKFSDQGHSRDTSSSLCQQNLSQARIAIQMFSTSNGRYPSSLKELAQSKPGLILRCDIDKQSYSYDPKNGRLGCTHQDHKRY